MTGGFGATVRRGIHRARSSRSLRRFRRLTFEAIEPRLLFSVDFSQGGSVDRIDDFAFVEKTVAGTASSPQSTVDLLAGLDQLRAAYGLTGWGQTVVVIDSGIAYDHGALGGGFGTGYRVVGGYDFAERDADPYDDGPLGAHGTHVAGILAGQGPVAPGVAPGVDLVALRVFDDSGRGDFAWVEEALHWVHAHRSDFPNPITTVNLSLGARWNSDSPPPWAMLEDELAQLEADGIFIAVAAGNGFVQYGTPGLSYPAASPHVVAVASVDADGALSYFSQRDRRAIAAPGRAILGTVPDYVGNRNGVADDYARLSGTSMAAPYVAGASALLREACLFAGIENVTQRMLYQTMVAAADTLYDPATGQTYRRLNLARAVDAVMPADEYGSTAESAHDLGLVVSDLSVSGKIGRLDDQDWFRFTAGYSGRATLRWTAPVAPDWRWEKLGPGVALGDDGLSASWNVASGTSYAFGLAAGELCSYEIVLAIEQAAPPVVSPPAAAIPLGAPRQQTFVAQAIAESGTWFALRAADDGVLTLEATADTAAEVRLELRDTTGQNLLAESAGSGARRIDFATSAGQDFLVRVVPLRATSLRVDLRVTNLLSDDGRTVTVLGTPSDDQFEFDAAAGRLAVNGVAYDRPARTAWNVHFVGGEGDDTLQMKDGPGDDSFSAGDGQAALVGDGYRLQGDGFEQVVAVAGAGGFDRATLYDSPSDDLLYAMPVSARLIGSGNQIEARGFARLDVFATAGGRDRAILHDSLGDDVLTLTPISAAMAGPDFHVVAWRFDQTITYALAGGADAVVFHDSPGSDVFRHDAGWAALRGRGFDHSAAYFENVVVHASAGGYDVAFLFDSPGNDLLQARRGAAMFASGFQCIELVGFDRVRAESRRGGVDRARREVIDYLLELPGHWT